MSACNEATAILEAILEADRRIQRLRDIQQKQNQIASVSAKRCGNCYFWMKTKCVPEKVHKQFKSHNSVGCELFELDSGSLRLAETFAAELAALKGGAE